MTKKDSRITFLSFMWMVGIVIFHSNVDCPDWYLNILSDFRIGGVSFFFIVSGYHLSRRYGEMPVWDWWKSEIVKRLRTLLIPYFLWCTFALTDFDLFGQYGITEVCPAAHIPLWYVKFLLMFCAVSLVVMRPIRYVAESRWFGLLYFVAWAVLPWIPIPMKFGFVLSFMMFSFGFGLRFVKRPVTLHRRWLPVLVALWVALHCFQVIHPLSFPTGDWAIRVYSATVLVAISWLVVNCIGHLEALPGFFEVSFFVYCSHILFLRLYFLPFPGILGNILTGVLTVAVCAAVGCLMRRYSRRLYGILAGSR